MRFIFCGLQVHRVDPIANPDAALSDSVIRFHPNARIAHLPIIGWTASTSSAVSSYAIHGLSGTVYATIYWHGQGCRGWHRRKRRHQSLWLLIRSRRRGLRIGRLIDHGAAGRSRGCGQRRGRRLMMRVTERRGRGGRPVTPINGAKLQTRRKRLTRIRLRWKRSHAVAIAYGRWPVQIHRLRNVVVVVVVV